MKIIYEPNDGIREFLDRDDIYITMAREGDVVAIAFKQDLGNGNERIFGHAMVHVPETDFKNDGRRDAEGMEDEFLAQFKTSNDIVKENVMCYFWHNTSNCTKCPKNGECNFNKEKPE